MSAETTFSEDLTNTSEMLTQLVKLGDEVCASLRKQALLAFTVTINGQSAQVAVNGQSVKVDLVSGQIRTY